MIKRVLVQYLDNVGCVDVARMKRIVDKYNVISFDIFDTLIKREVAEPTDVFRRIEEKTGIEGFAADRIAGEVQARKKSLSGEVDLADIYKQMTTVSLNSMCEAMDLECKTEIDICHVNKTIFPLYQYCVERKRVVIASDMYLPRDVIEKLLNRNGISGYEKIYISHELHRSKRRGDMYDSIKSTIGKEKIVHVGNSFKADYLRAVLKGVGAIKIPTNL